MVHCSTGGGRTGTFIALSTLLDVIDDPAECVQPLDIFNTVLELRRQRGHMVSWAGMGSRFAQLRGSIIFACRSFS